MILSVQVNNRTYKIDCHNPIDISIPLNFNGAQPNAYDVEKATSKPCEAESLIGDTRRGGSCNFEQITFIPHCNGTHTEAVGHITNERISVHNCLKDAFILSTLVTVEPETANETTETYAVKLNENDCLITRKAVENALQNPKSKIQNLKADGLIIRTLPNDESKKTRRYMENLPPFFSTEAIKFITERSVKHLLVDMPSIDKTFDEGKLSNHRIFWNVEAENFELSEESFRNNTITEMIFVPEFVEDGTYFLNLQIAAFQSDTSPSRPILFRISE
ncbi:MAG TPA: cyclase family protein [Pyrinomonadaceae bacterium]|nr:cyclase family protein [Pyrinomonadaceae bacterium]